MTKILDAFTGELIEPNFTGFRFSRPREEPDTQNADFYRERRAFYRDVLAKYRPEAKPAEPKADAEGWIEWAGGECPVPPDTRIELRYRNGNLGWRSRACARCWDHIGDCCDIVAYRLVEGL